MRLRPRRSLALGATALLAGIVGALAVASPALAYDLCHNHFPTITITTAGSYSGTSGNDVVVIKHSSGTVYFDPVDGHDEICADGVNWDAGPVTIWAAGDGHKILGSTKSDKIYGSSGSDEVYGNGGDDLIKGNGGGDDLDGGSGDDYVRGNSGDDFVSDESGDNCLLGGAGDDVVFATDNEGQSTILLGHDGRYNEYQCAPADSDSSQAAADFINSNTIGADSAIGGRGDDRIWGSNGNDGIDGKTGNDSIRGFNGSDSLGGGGGADSLNGGYGDDILKDDADNAIDFLYGGPGNDKFTAKSNDTCYAGWDPPSMSCTPSPVYG